ncbi:YqaA family protein [Chiayiivirga flava]|uniref:Membrane protein YqaA with SNARE-associated domain n=1 Tax=Chiayiivirga flava TaxID=659595 RepID=A0A7W8D7M5_9GAMM|nr:YqaA family protein [Chiayiivirga flava]MBB5209082.1 membrane protein YqaA with SNARE-associated domain [Chiayiivirga flava]
MKLFAPMYERTLRWAAHPRAPALLTGLSFIEAIFFPVPPEVMLAPMSLAQPGRAFRFATLSLLGSLVGMFIGYAIGYFALELAMPLLERAGYAEHFDDIKRQAAENGFWLLLIAGFTPIPFKVFTLASGAVGMPLLPFFFGALIGRGKRVYLVAAAIRLGGARAEAMLRRHVEPIGWIALVLLAGLVAWLVVRGGGA